MKQMSCILVAMLLGLLQACGSDSPVESQSPGDGDVLTDAESDSDAASTDADLDSSNWENTWQSDVSEQDSGVNSSPDSLSDVDEVEDSSLVDIAVGECVEGEPCDDGNPCTGVASCVMGECVAIAPKCFDGIPCTLDLCDESDGTCTHPLNEGSCYIDNVCVPLGEPNPDDDCLECFPALSTTEWVTPVEECNGVDDDCDGQLDEGCDLFPSFSWWPANPSPGQALLIRVEDVQFRGGGRLAISGECGTMPVIFYGVEQEGENWVWEFGIETVPPGTHVVEFLEQDVLVGLATLKSSAGGECPENLTPDIVVSPFAPAIGDPLVVELVSNLEWGAPELEVRDSCGLVSVTSTEDPLVVETAPVQGGIVTYSWRDGPYGTLISHGTIAVAGSPFCPTADLVDSDGDGLHDLEDNCPGLSNPSQHDQDNDGIGDPCDPWAKGLVPDLVWNLSPSSIETGEPGVISLQTPDEYVGIEVSCTGPCGDFGGLMNDGGMPDEEMYGWEFPLIPASGGSYLCQFSVLGGGTLPAFEFEVSGEVVCAGCGDSECGEGENCESCSLDCECALCGDGVCGLEESCSSCSLDCPCPFVCEELGAACSGAQVSEENCGEDDVLTQTECEVYGICSGIGGPQMCSWGSGSWCNGLCENP